MTRLICMDAPADMGEKRLYMYAPNNWSANPLVALQFHVEGAARAVGDLCGCHEGDFIWDADTEDVVYRWGAGSVGKVEEEVDTSDKEAAHKENAAGKGQALAKEDLADESAKLRDALELCRMKAIHIKGNINVPNSVVRNLMEIVATANTALAQTPKNQKVNKKYEFTGETKELSGHILRRIRAVRGFGLVLAGEVGGWIESEENLSVSDGAWVSGNAQVYGDAWVYGDALVSGNARVGGNARVFGDAQVYGNAIVDGKAQVYCDAHVYGNAIVDGKAQVYCDAQVFGDAIVFGHSRVFGVAKVYGSAQVSGDAMVGGDAKVASLEDVIWIKNCWTSGRTFTYTRSNGKWLVGCFNGTGKELIEKAYKDGERSGKCYEAVVRAVEAIVEALSEGGEK